jgi:acetate kinase
VIFTGGIGENAPEVREWTLENMEYMGLHLDVEKNRSIVGGEAEISTQDSPVKAMVIPTNEERVIARDVVRVLNGIMPVFKTPDAVS